MIGMAIKFPSDEWVKELCNKLNASESYAQTAATLGGDNTFIILPDADYPDTTYLYINLTWQSIRCQTIEKSG